MTDSDRHAISSLEALLELYDAPSERAILKQIDHLDAHCRAFISASPFVVLATAGRGGVDCSPRGEKPGFVLVEDDHTLLIADRRGNNRLDSLRNIIEDPAVGLLFLVPGVNETLRINGRARITVDPAVLARFTVAGHPPRSVLAIQVREAFLQCGKALIRSSLWDPARFVERSTLPSTGQVLAAHTSGKVIAEEYDRAVEGLLRDTLY